MPSPRQSSVACWTCKVRRKKCDQGLPTCKDCTALEIDCHYSPDRPTWMDNGSKQQEMADRLKVQVKHNTVRRVQRNKIQQLSRGLEDAAATEEESTLARDSPSIPQQLESLHAFGTNTDSPWASFPTPESPAKQAATPIGSAAAPSEREDAETPQGYQHGADPAADHESSDFESGLLMAYLDYAFPVLFPFYRPSILEGGRAWLLTLALKFPAFYHNAIGLAAYFYCAVPVLPGPEHYVCAEKAHGELQVQMEKAVQGVQDSLRQVTELGVHHCLAENIRLLGNIVQLVNFEVVFASSANWQMHLTAAVDLFDQTLQCFGDGGQETTMMSTLLEKLRGNVPLDCSILSSEQAALRFFAAMVIHQDVIAGATREKSPRLMKYHDELLAEPSTLDATSQLLNLEHFTGCPNWALRSIAEVTCLNEWKQSAKRSGVLDIVDLVQRAALIHKSLHDGNAGLDRSATHAPSQMANRSYHPLDFILAKSGITNGATPSQLASSRAIGKIWAHAAEVYLITVLSGWQPCNVQLRSHVGQALNHLRAIDNPSWLRTLAWPFCVLGCFATEDQEVAFRAVANASGGLAMFGTLRDAIAIMEKVWSLRYQHDADKWDIAYCLRMLGHSVLLV